MPESIAAPRPVAARARVRRAVPRSALPRRARPRRPVLAALAALASLAGCADFSGIAPSSTMVAPQAVGLDVEHAAVDWPRGAWWRRYGDARLDALVERALADGPTVAIAAARLARASAGESLADAERGPQVTGVVESTRQRYTETGLVPPPRAGSVASSNSATAALGWELDLFGRHRALLDAAVGRRRAAEADLHAARALLATQVVRGYVELARLVGQRDVAAQALAQHERTAALIRERVQSGVDARAALRSAEAAPPDTRRRIAEIDERIALARNALAALTAQPPSALASLAPALPEASVVAPPGAIPADLLGRRADVVAARWRVESALHDRDAATAQFYPNVNLAAFAGFSSLGVSRWFESGSLVYGAGPAIRLPLFDAGRLRANLRGVTADADVAIHAYNATVVDAVREVADHVASLRALATQAREQRASQAADEDALAIATQRHRAGVGSLLAVLATEVPVIAQRALAIDQRARALDLDAGLARALGGGALDDVPGTRSDR